MRFHQLTPFICITTIHGAAVDVMLPPTEHFITMPTIPKTEDSMPTDVPATEPIAAKRYAAVRAHLGPLIDAWRSGAIPIPRYNHKSHAEVVSFLEYYGKSSDGFFGLDKVHKPSLSRIMRETVPGWLAGPTVAVNRDLEIGFGKTVYFRGHTGVYEIIELPNKIIKYYSFCYEPSVDKIDAVVVETYFANRVAIADPSLAVPVDFYSGSVGNTSPNSKIPNAICNSYDDDDGNEIPVFPRIRYLIMPKVGKSLYQYMIDFDIGQGIDFVTAMKLGGQMIDLVDRLHAMNIIHGDAHISNFAFTDDTNTKLILIDFGRGQLLDPEYQRTVDLSTFCDNIDWLHPYTGKWEMKNCKPSFRDDVYRAVQMVAMSLYGMRHFNTLNGWLSYPGIKREQYKRIKNSGDFWEFGDLKLQLQDPHADTIRTHLREISRLTVEDHPEAPYTKPQYGLIKDQFGEIISVLTGTRKDDPLIFDL